MTNIEVHLKEFVANKIKTTYVGNEYGCLKELAWEQVQKEINEFFAREGGPYDKDDSRGCSISSEV